MTGTVHDMSIGIGYLQHSSLTLYGICRHKTEREYQAKYHDCSTDRELCHSRKIMTEEHWCHVRNCFETRRQNSAGGWNGITRDSWCQIMRIGTFSLEEVRSSHIRALGGVHSSAGQDTVLSERNAKKIK